MREAEGSFIRKLAIWVTGFLVLLSGGEAGAQPTAYGLAA